MGRRHQEGRIMSEELDNSAVFAMDNPEMDWGQPEAVQPDAAQTIADPTAVVATEQAAAVPDPQENAFKAIREAERARAQAEAERAYQMGQQAAYERMQAQAQPVEDDFPDPVIDPAGYARAMRDQIVRELAPHIQQSQQQSASVAYAQNLQMARALEPNFDTYLAAANGLVAKYPSLVNEVQSSDNPGLRIIELGKMALSSGGVNPADGGISEAVRQKVLADEAAKRAASGQPPNVTLPRGVGQTPSGAGMSDVTPPPSEWGRIAAANPAEWDRIRASALGSNGGVL